MENKFYELMGEGAGVSATKGLALILGCEPTALAATATAFVAKNIVQGSLEKIHTEFLERSLTEYQGSKVEQVMSAAQRKYYQMVNQQGWQLVHPEADYYVKGVVESIERAVLIAMNEAEQNKINVHGNVLGNYFVLNQDWSDYHFQAKLIEKLTWRQLVLIHLISNHFPGCTKGSCIHNHTACVEVNELLRYGVWAQKGSPYDMNNSDPICIYLLEPTDFAHSLASMMSIADYGQGVIDDVINTLEMYEDNVETHTMQPITSKEVDEKFRFEEL